MVTRRRLVIALGASALAAPLASLAQQPARIPRIGYLATPDPAVTPHLLDAFRAGLREHGYIEGQNIVMEYRWVEGTSQRFDDLAVDLVRSKVELILAWSTPAVIAAKQATSTIPIVMLAVGDPVGAGLVASLARPGGNITGLTNSDVELAPKRLQLLKEVLPRLSRVAVLRNPTNLSGELQFRETQAAARSLGIELQLVDVRDPKELEGAFLAMAKARAGALTVLADPMFISRPKQIANLAMRSRLPSAFARRENAEAGGLMSYGPNNADLFRQAATYVNKILKGAKPADLPVEQATRFALVVNLKTAKALGIKIPNSILVRADKVIE